jgi:multiple antibiotic resistance protein
MNPSMDLRSESLSYPTVGHRYNSDSDSIEHIMDKALIFNFAAAMLSIVNPFGNLPLFISYTAGERKRVRNWLAVFIALTVLGLLTIFLLIGTELLNFFGITIPAFQISGGILLLLTGIEMVHGKKTIDNPGVADKLYRDDLKEAESIFSKILVPLGIPLFVGPGAISTVILYRSRVRNRSTLLGEIAVLVGTSLIVLLTLLMADRIQRLLGAIGIEIATRLLGLVLAAIGVQFILNGLANATVGVINPAVTR